MPSHSQSVKSKWGRTKDADEHMGWVFPASDTEEPGAEPDPLNGAKSIRELYELASTNYSGKYTVPVCANSSSLWMVFLLIQVIFHACISRTT